MGPQQMHNDGQHHYHTVEADVLASIKGCHPMPSCCCRVKPLWNSNNTRQQERCASEGQHVCFVMTVSLQVQPYCPTSTEWCAAHLRGLHPEQVNMELALRDVVKAAVQAAQRGRRVQPHRRLDRDAVEVGEAGWDGGRRAVAVYIPCSSSDELSPGAVRVALCLPHMHAATCCPGCPVGKL